MGTTYKYNLWTKEEEEKLKSLVGKTSFNKMVEYFTNRTGISLLKKSIKLGLSSEYKNFKYTKNINYWKELNLNNCYYAGFIASDGNLKKDSYCLQINLSSKDVGLLKRFKEEVEFTGNIRIHIRKKYNSENFMEVCYVNINKVKEWYFDLNKYFNITPQKTHTLKPPNINNNYLEMAYLIGLIDGDGWVCKFEHKNRLGIGFVGASLPMVEWVKNKFLNLINNGYSIERKKKNGKLTNCYTIAIRGIYAAVVIDYLQQFPIPKLDRKWNNPEVLKYIEEQKQKYPNLFLTLDQSEIIKYIPKNNPSQSEVLV